MSSQDTNYEDSTTPMPDLDVIPKHHRDDVERLFETWSSVRARNAELSMYYNMKNAMKDLGIAIPPQLTDTNSVVGWAQKAVQVMAVRSKFDGFVFAGKNNEELDRLVRQNRLLTLYQRASQEALTHGCSAMTVMRGGKGQPGAKVRSFSANQCALLWDKDADRVGCGVTLVGVDDAGCATKYVAHFEDQVLTITRKSEDRWECIPEDNVLGRPMIEPFIFNADDDRPLGRSRITPEVMGIIDKAMRDVLRMEVGAEFFTAPQRYILGATDDLFAETMSTIDEIRREVNSDDDLGPDDGVQEQHYQPTQADYMRAYIGSWFAVTRDENGELPVVGQFPAGSAQNFITVFENDAQRFSGATNVPLGQLGVLSNTYTSSDALSAANDPLILEVERMNVSFAGSMEEVGRMMMAVSGGISIDELTEEQQAVQAYFRDPAQPTIAAMADAWTKIGSVDSGLVGTRIWYERLGLPQATIDRIIREKDEHSAIASINNLATLLKGGHE